MKNWKIVLFAGAAFAASYAVAQTAPEAPAAPVAEAAAVVQEATTSVDSKFGKIQLSSTASEKASVLAAKVAAPKGANTKSVVETMVAAMSKLCTPQQKAAVSAFLSALKKAELPELDGEPLAINAEFGADGSSSIKLSIAGKEFSMEPKVDVKDLGSVAVVGQLVSGETKTNVDVVVANDGSVTGKVGEAEVSDVAPKFEAPVAAVVDSEIATAEGAAAAIPDASERMTDQEISALE